MERQEPPLAFGPGPGWSSGLTGSGPSAGWESWQQAAPGPWSTPAEEHREGGTHTHTPHALITTRETVADPYQVAKFSSRSILRPTGRSADNSSFLANKGRKKVQTESMCQCVSVCKFASTDVGYAAPLCTTGASVLPEAAVQLS